MKDNVLTQLAALKKMEPRQLKEKWRELFGNEPPAFNRGYLESRLAYRIQELALGGLNKETLGRINRLRADMVSGMPLREKEKGRPLTGTILVREHDGIEHRVQVLAEGFEYNGKRYRSLTAIAKQITGTHWNGPMFFGLRRRS